MNRVQSYIVKKSSKDYKTFLDLSHKSKNLYNVVNYILRQLITGKIENLKEYSDLIKTVKKNVQFKDGSIKEITNYYISEFDLSKRMRKIEQIDYMSLKSQCSQQIISLVFKDYNLFYKSIKEYYKNPSKFKSKPKLPKYKDKNGLFIVVYTNQSCSIDKDGYLNLGKGNKIESVKTNLTKRNFNQVRIIPKLDYFKVEILYEKEIKRNENIRTNNVGIDIGINNLATVTSDNNKIPFIVNGRPIKSINQYYNKQISKLKNLYSKHGIHTGKLLRKITFKRNMKIEDYLHKSSRKIVDWCNENNIKTVFIGHNNGWKDKVKMGKCNNQNFVQIPFNRFIFMLEYKLEEIGIDTVIVNEAYTSKCSFLDNEEISKHEIYKGKRIKRGLFKSEHGKFLNSDVNGSLNILKSRIGNFNITNPFNPDIINVVHDVKLSNG